MATEMATFAAGCFWGVEETFRRTEGVLATEVGYTGGATEHPSYKQVCAGDTGHAEAVRVTFDPDIVSYEQLVHLFFEAHDPTQHHRQGPDVGSQYRSAIFYHDDEQQCVAQRMKQQLENEGGYSHPVVTEITLAATFYPAEAYHQQYLAKRGRGACDSTVRS
jgi:peptide-methionine (S)-S-oxide reductase